MYLKNIAKKNNNKDYYIINSEVSLFITPIKIGKTMCIKIENQDLGKQNY